MTGRFVNIEEVEQTIKRIKEIVEKNKELKSELTKYKRAFEILKKVLNIDLVYTDEGCEPTWFLDSNGGREIEQEQYELLEELMKSESV